MRAVYKREHKRVLDSKRKGSSKPHVPGLWYYNLLSFIQPKSKTYQSENESFQDDDSNSDEEPSKTEEIPNQEELTKINSDNELTLETSKHNLIKIVQEVLEAVKKPPNSFGVYVGEQLLTLDKFQRQIAEKLISDVIFLAKNEKLDLGSTVLSTVQTPKILNDNDPLTHDTPNPSSNDVKPSVSRDFVKLCPSETSRSSSPAQYIKSSISPEPSPPESPQFKQSSKSKSPSPEKIQTVPISKSSKTRSPSPEKIQTIEAIPKSSVKKDESTSQNTLTKGIWCSPSTKVVQTSQTIKTLKLSPAPQTLQTSPVKVIKIKKTPKIVLQSSALKKIRIATIQNNLQQSTSIIKSSTPMKIESPSLAKKMRLSSPSCNISHLHIPKKLTNLL